MFGKKKMSNSDQMKELKGSTLQSALMGILFVLSGVLLLLNPGGVAKAVCFSIGSILTLIGVINLFIYFVSDVKNNLGRNKFIIGIVLIILGLFFVIGYRTIMEIMARIMGVLIIFNGIMKLQSALNAMKMKAKGFIFFVLVAVATILVGFVFVVQSFESTKMVLRLVGLFLLITGMIDIVNVIYIRKKLENYLKDMEALTQDAKEL